MEIGLTKESRQGLGEGLSQLLADTYTLYLKTQHAHWNIQGPHFYPLHLLFEVQYTELATAIDAIAERIRALGLFVEASLTYFKHKTAIKEDNQVGSQESFLHSLIEAHETLLRHTRRLSLWAEKEGDGATVDLLGKRLDAHETMSWFLRSHLAPLSS